MKVKYLLTGVLLGFSLLANSHPLHLTFTNLEFKTQNSHWLLTIKVFSDDFGANLKTITGTEPVFDKKSKNSEVDGILKIWLQNRMEIWFDSKLVELNTWKFEGIKVKDDASWITYSFAAPFPINEIKIRNALFFDLYPDQKNLFVLTLGQFESSHEFKKKDQETIIKLNK